MREHFKTSYALFSLLLALVYAQDECGVTYFNQNARIVGGNTANPGSWPASAFILFNYKKTVTVNGVSFTTSTGFMCGGTLIDRSTVLTAAHCITTTISYSYNGASYETSVEPNSFYPTFGSMYKVYLGFQDISKIGTANMAPGIEVSVVDVISHPSYNPSNFQNDLAILKLSRSVVLNQYIQIACLPEEQSSTYPVPEQPSWIVGWGTTSSGGSTSDILLNAKIIVYASSQCSAVSGVKFWNGQICAGIYEGGKDTCQGDSGGSLYVNQTINGRSKFVSAGIVSYGDGCALRGKPGIYTRVSYYLPWIRSYMSNPPTVITRTTTPSSFNTLTRRNLPRLSILDNTVVSDSIIVNQNGRLESIAIDIDITHTYIGDLLVTITAPDSRVLRLHARTGESTDNIMTTYPSLTLPEDDLAILKGINILGTWKLSVSDLGADDTGTFNSWTLNLYYSNSTPVTTPRPLTTTRAPTTTTRLPTTTRGPTATTRPPTTTTRTTTRSTTSSTAVLNNSTFTTKTNFPSLAIPDLRTISDIISITDVGRLSAITVDIDITHPYIGDLLVTITAPDSTVVVLHNRGGGSTDDIKTSYPSLSIPFSSLNVLNGKSINGNWILSVTDQAEQDQGRLNSWGLKLSYSNAPVSNFVVNRQRTVSQNVLDNATVNNTFFLTESGRVTSVSVQVDITHPYKGDLVVRLIAPDNTVIRLHNRSGGSADDIKTSYPQTASVDSLTLLNGKSVTGAWTLSVSDQDAGDQGVFNSWSLTINYSN